MRKRLEQFKEASRAYSDASVMMHEAIAHKAGLSGADHKYLGLIMQRGEITAGEIAAATGLTTGAVTGIIDRLEKKKLVKRQYAATDRRKVIIVPNTQNAMKLLAPLFQPMQLRTEKMLGTFSAKELDVIERYFLSAVEVIQETINELNTKKKAK